MPGLCEQDAEFEVNDIDIFHITYTRRGFDNQREDQCYELFVKKCF